MTNFILCDDESRFLESLKRLLEEYHSKNCHIEISISAYTNPQTLLDNYKKTEETILLLDISMPPFSGIVLAEKIRDIDKNASIIFITGNPEYRQRALELHSFNYLTKPITRKKLWKLLNDYYDYKQEFVNEKSAILFFSYNNEEIQLYVDSIYYIEQYHNKTFICLQYKKIEVYTTLKEVNSILPKHFYQCHKSFIVNTAKILRRSRRCCYLRNGGTIPIGPTKVKDFKEHYINHIWKVNDFDLE